MPLIATIGRRYWRTRCLIAAIYLLLIVGAATMVYPFLIMLAGTTKSGGQKGSFYFFSGFPGPVGANNKGDIIIFRLAFLT